MQSRLQLLRQNRLPRFPFPMRNMTPFAALFRKEPPMTLLPRSMPVSYTHLDVYKRQSRDVPQNVRFMNLDWLQSHNLAVDRNNYDLIYTAPLNGSGSTMEQLETLYKQFNLQKPVDFHSPSLSVSDIVAIKQDGKVSCH